MRKKIFIKLLEKGFWWFKRVEITEVKRIELKPTGKAVIKREGETI